MHLLYDSSDHPTGTGVYTHTYTLLFRMNSAVSWANLIGDVKPLLQLPVCCLLWRLLLITGCQLKWSYSKFTPDKWQLPVSPKIAIWRYTWQLIHKNSSLGDQWGDLVWSFKHVAIIVFVPFSLNCCDGGPGAGITFVQFLKEIVFFLKKAERMVSLIWHFVLIQNNALCS